MDTGAIIAVIFFIILAFIGFCVYFIFKILEFVIQAINLYKKMIIRQDMMIKLLKDISGKKTTDSDLALEEGSTLDSDDLDENNELSKSIEAIICESCGYRNNKDDKFCRKCGKKLI